MTNPKRAFWNTAFALLVVLRSATTSHTAVAQTTSENAAQAETLFRDGRTLIKAGRTSDACAKFAESHRLDPQTGTLLNLALCHEEEGKTASAWAEFNEVTERSGPTSERTEFAHRHARTVEGRLSRLKVRVEPAVRGLSLTLDGRPLRPAALGSLIPLDPGNHTVEATAPGKEHWVERVRVNAGPVTQELIVKLADAPAAPPPTAAAPAPAALSPLGAPTAADPTSTSTTRRDVGLAIGAVGLVGIGVGTGYGLQAFSKKTAVETLCPPPNPCSDPNYTSAGEAKRELDKAAIISTIGFGVGVVGLATSLYLVLTSPSSKSPANNVHVSPMLAGSAAGVAIERNF